MYLENASARRAWEAAAELVGWDGVPVVPFVWSGTQWVTPAGEWRDIPLIRRGMGEWLVAAARKLADVPGERERQQELRGRMLDARFSASQAADGEREALERISDELARELAFAPEVHRLSDDPSLPRHVKTVADEMLSASDTRATQLLSLASQFDPFRAPMRDPADWVVALGAAPRSEHVRTSTVWEAFSVDEPALARSLGVRVGKSVLFAAMDKRFGARRKLGGYDGWRGVMLAG
ncbi:hypothetical protein ACFQ6N_22460 [Kitasatospora sp. NPDC056446]|uniref:hypothetical protein n=1 Tax=Kitasatospora sp. NPDC056446 TaxID=3345819 RepID=UPI0036C7E0C4